LGSAYTGQVRVRTPRRIQPLADCCGQAIRSNKATSFPNVLPFFRHWRGPQTGARFWWGDGVDGGHRVVPIWRFAFQIPPRATRREAPREGKALNTRQYPATSSPAGNHSFPLASAPFGLIGHEASKPGNQGTSAIKALVPGKLPPFCWRGFQAHQDQQRKMRPGISAVGFGIWEGRNSDRELFIGSRGRDLRCLAQRL